MDTSDEWIRQRSGIEERRWAEDHESGTSMSKAAAEMALKNAGVGIDDVDGLVHGTLSPDHFFPGTAACVQGALGMKQKPHFDIRGQCSGFLYAMSVAYGLIESGQAETLLVVCSEIQSRGLDLSTRGRGTAVLFGDGAGAIVVQKSEQKEDKKEGLLSICLHSDGSYVDKLWCEKPGVAASPFLPEDQGAESRFPQMEGQFVFKNAVTRMPEVLGEALEKAELGSQDVDHFLFHQANLRINEFVAKTLKIPAEKVPNNIQKYGNCSSASIPILLAENIASGNIKPGQRVAMTAFGSGFTWGSCVLVI
jgi:3-oxoacyl-[acyl-carrier-protein] synthase-3